MGKICAAVIVGVPGGITATCGELGTRCSGKDCGLSCCGKDELSDTCPASRVCEVVLSASTS